MRGQMTKQIKLKLTPGTNYKQPISRPNTITIPFQTKRTFMIFLNKLKQNKEKQKQNNKNELPKYKKGKTNIKKTHKNKIQTTFNKIIIIISK